MNVLLTGASGGIGKAVAEFLIVKGVNVYAIDLAEAKFNSESLKFFNADITNKDQLVQIFNELKADSVIFDAIVNVAGIFYIDSFTEIPFENLEKIFNVNLFGAININKIFYPILRKNGKVIITTSEVAPLDPLPFNGIYSTTKTALDCYSQALRQELNLLGQKVITVRPGAFNTSLSQGALIKTKELTDKTTIFKKQSVKFYGLVKMFMGTPSNPKKIAKLYYKAITSKGNKIIYKKHTNILLKLMNILPKRLQCFIVKRLLKTKSK